MIGSTNDRIYEYTLSTPWDISTAVYNQYISTQDNAPGDIFLSPDGMKMYETGMTNDRIYESTLSTPWDISTAVYNQYISTQAGETRGIFFSPDGTKIYEAQDFNNRIYEYDIISSAEATWDISIAVMVQDIATSDTSIQGITFSPDGTKMYEIGSTNNRIYEYTLSTPWDISTAVYNQYISTQDGIPTGFCFSPDGTKMYETGMTNDRIYEYTLSIPWDISTAVYNQYISTQDDLPHGIFLSTDGTKMYEIGSTNDRIYEYTLSTPWDISTAVYNQYISTQDNAPGDIFLSPDGMKMYETGTTNDRIYESTLSTPWDISTAVYNQYISTQAGETRGIFFSPDGTKIYEAQYFNNRIYEYDIKSSAEAIQLFTAGEQESGTIEFWVRTNNASETHNFNVENGGSSNAISIRIDSSILYYNDGTDHPLMTINNGIWYHFKVEFDTTSDWHLWVNQGSIDEGAGFKYLGNPFSMDQVNIFLESKILGTHLYIDAIGYSWDPNYGIGDNLNEGLLLSYENTTALDWTGYSLDGASNVMITGNTTIPMPTGNGLHSIQVFGNTSSGIMFQSDIRYFTLDWEYISLRPTTNYIDMIDDLDLFVEISMNSIGFLKVDKTSFGYPTFPYLNNNQTRVTFYNFVVFNAYFDEDELMVSGITLRFYYNPIDVSNPANLRVYHYRSSQGEWISEAVTLNQTGNYIEITITELSWFAFAEFQFPPDEFPFWLLLLIIFLSIIGVSIPSYYVVISKKKKKGIIKTKRQELLEENLTPHKIEKILQREKVPEIRREQVTPIPPVESKVVRKIEPHKKLREEKKEIEKTSLQVENEVEEKKRDIEEMEREIDITEDVDKCVIHKGSLTGITFICPKCKSKYCLKCAKALSKRKENCWVCEGPINIDSGGEKIPAELNKIQKNPLDNSNLLQVVEGENIIEKIARSGGIDITLLKKDFLAKVDQFDWEENDKIEFIREMLSLSPQKRELILNRMIKKSARDEDM